MNIWPRAGGPSPADQVMVHGVAPAPGGGRGVVLVSYRIVSYRIVSYRILSYPILSYPILSYRIVSYRIVSYRIVSYRIVWYGLVWYGKVWYGMVWYGVVCHGRTLCRGPGSRGTIPLGGAVIPDHRTIQKYVCVRANTQIVCVLIY